jgi:hypothetical protein
MADLLRFPLKGRVGILAAYRVDRRAAAVRILEDMALPDPPADRLYLGASTPSAVSLGVTRQAVLYLGARVLFS